jgi:nitroreductase
MAVIPWPLQPVPRGGKAAAPAASATEAEAWALLRARRTVQPARLAAPGPGPAELAAILEAAAHAPDPVQGPLPWRLVLVPHAARGALARVCGPERANDGTSPASPSTPDKRFGAPVMLLAVADTGGSPARADLCEGMVSAGCALQSMLLMATAQGYGASLLAGDAIKAPGLQAFFGLGAHETALCFLCIGTVPARKVAVRVRPAARTYVSTLEPDGSVVPLRPRA